MEFTAKQISKLIKGEIVGDKNARINNLSKIEDGKPGTLSFLANNKYEKYIFKTQASVVIVSKDFHTDKKIKTTLIKVDEPYVAFATLLEHYKNLRKPQKGISEFSYISESAKIKSNCYVGNFTHIGNDASVGKNVLIYPQVFIGDNVQIGSDTIIYPGVKIYEDCVIGDNCTIHSGTIIGADGFGFAPQQEGQAYKKVAQIGNVIIEDNVEIGANVTIDRATLGSTKIKKGVKIDNLIQIAHNVVINENTVMASQSGVSGSTVIGKNCMIGGQVGTIGHIKIGDNVKIAAQSGISSDVKDNAVLFGSPAIEVMNFKKSYVHFKNLDKLNKRIENLERKIKELNAEEK